MATWVVQTRGKYSGRIGTVEFDYAQLSKEIGNIHLGCDINVRFGAGGPVVGLKWSSVRKATQAEIAEKLGCRVQDLPSYLISEHPE
ncbi:hypothetical protein [Mesorhizobium sp.]|uniref:hypothetical protein n=1 Tax=Mesorhizobium sp. TaxID=1871066 RepID=UPI000FE3E55A|nr:hypothetical protein [Mesorhizobium sp.]RWJ03414.1 MAG: hypothetical protein EOR24_32045 [Mesorhizobium sp.]